MIGTDQPNLDKPLSRWNYDHWGRRHGVAHALGAVRWSILAALASALPNIALAVETIAWLAGVSERTVQRALPELRRIGAIAYDENRGGKGRVYRVSLADVRLPEVAQRIITQSTGGQPATTSKSDTLSPFGTAKGDSLPVNGDTVSAKGDALPANGCQGVTRSPQRKSASKDTSKGKGTPPSASSHPTHPSGPIPVEETDEEPKASTVDHPSMKETPTSVEKSSRRKVPRQKLTEQERQLALSCPLRLTASIIHGADAISVPVSQWPQLPVTAKHWSPNSRDLDTPEPSATEAQLAWFFWCRASIARHSAGDDLYFPAFGRLVGGVKTLVKSRGRDRAITIMQTLTGRWPEVRQRLAWMADLTLDETSLSHPKIIEAALAVDRGARPTPAAAGLTNRPHPVGQEEIRHEYAADRWG